MKKIMWLIVLFSTNSYAALMYNEAVDGDLAGFGETPSQLVVMPGSNVISGSVGPSATDRQDRFGLNPTSGMVTGIFLDDYANPGMFGDFDSRFFGVTNSGNFLNGPNIDITDIGTDLLATLTTLLPAGEAYTFFGLDEQNSTATYSLRVEVSAVPVPAAVWLFGSALIGLFGVPRSKQSKHKSPQ